MGLVIKTVCQLAQVVTATEKFAFQRQPKYRQRMCTLRRWRQTVLHVRTSNTECTAADGGPSRPRDVQSGRGRGSQPSAWLQGCHRLQLVSKVWRRRIMETTENEHLENGLLNEFVVLVVKDNWEPDLVFLHLLSNVSATTNHKERDEQRVSYLGDKDAWLINTERMTRVVCTSNNAQSKRTSSFMDHHRLQPEKPSSYDHPIPSTQFNKHAQMLVLH